MPQWDDPKWDPPGWDDTPCCGKHAMLWAVEPLARIVKWWYTR